MSRLTAAHGVRAAANWLNLTTPLGLAVALAGRSRLRWGPEGLILAEGYRLRFPIAGAFTVGNVVATASDLDTLEARCPGTLGHEARHAWQYAAGGVWFFPAYTLATAWSLLRSGNPAIRNPLERHAGLVTGGYVHPETGEPHAPGWSIGGLVAEFRARRGRSGAGRSGPAGASPAGG
ncbi:hypothetical protein [Propioniciclava sp.]|uniref:hypothetical protein n=1 Tax=Propioniciclava sp. TaxID=2038686 RepID=UPI0026301F4A|nr:hypothetical protein [Propioniciclava sp.]